MRTDQPTTMENPRYHIKVINGVLCKECTDCHRVLDLYACYYYKKINGKWSKWCKECYQKHNRMNREKRREKQEKERRERAEKMREAVLQVTVPAVRRAVKNERLRKIDEALAKVAAMKEEKRKKEEAEEAERMTAKKRSKPDPVPVKKPKRRLEPTDEPCKHCKSFSPISGHKLCQQGFCLKHRRTEHAENTCGDFRPNIKIKYVI